MEWKSWLPFLWIFGCWIVKLDWIQFLKIYGFPPTLLKELGHWGVSSLKYGTEIYRLLYILNFYRDIFKYGIQITFFGWTFLWQANIKFWPFFTFENIFNISTVLFCKHAYVHKQCRAQQNTERD